MLAHEQTAADAADENGDGVAAKSLADAVDGLPCGRSRAGRQPIEISTHELRGPILRYVAGECHGPRLAVDGEDGADNIVLRPLGIENAQWEQQTGSGQSLGLGFAEIALIEIERGLAIEFEQYIAARFGYPAARSKFVPAA